jgi:hypothetical protein
MPKRSGSKGKPGNGVESVVDGIKRDAAPALAKALNLDSAEAVEAAMNAGMELFLAARAVIRSMPLPPEARAHLDRAEVETLRAARMAARGMGVAKRAKAQGPAKKVAVDFASKGPSPARKASKKP